MLKGFIHAPRTFYRAHSFFLDAYKDCLVFLSYIGYSRSSLLIVYSVDCLLDTKQFFVDLDHLNCVNFTFLDVITVLHVDITNSEHAFPLMRTFLKALENYIYFFHCTYHENKF